MKEPKFKVRVNAKSKLGDPSFMYWTLSGSTINFDKAHVFTESTVPDFFKQSLNQPYIEKVYVD